MDKSCHNSTESTTSSNTSSSSSSTNNGKDQHLRHLNKLSHQISKPVIRKPPPDQSLNHLLQHHRPPATAPPPPSPLPAHQQQPPVYNINKNDFRDVVQKLTGSPAHERLSTPPPIHPPKPQSSRLYRIRPPPLAAVGNRPPPALVDTAPTNAAAADPDIPRPTAAPPMSPLPALPSVHGAAESPITAYMRFLHGSASAGDSDPKQFPMPMSPLPFGSLPLPRSAFAMPSPGLPLSPTAGQLGFPASPRIPMPSPPPWRSP